MRQVHHISKPEGLVEKVFRAAFPSYGGKKFKLVATETVDVRSYWDGGSKTTFVGVGLTVPLQTVRAPNSHPIFDPAGQGSTVVTLPLGAAIVAHSIFCGKDMGLTVYVSPSQLATSNLIPKPIQVSEDEGVVLKFTSHYKNTYGGVSNLRFKEANRSTKITAERWEAAKVALIERGLLRKNGSITPEGRNAAPDRY